MKTGAVSLLRLLALGVACGPLPAAEPALADSDYVPCKIQQRVKIEFPVRALSEGVVRGRAVLLLDVDHTGKLLDVLALGYTRPEFADAALEAAKFWRFIPGRVAGDPVGSTITLTVNFELSGVLAYVKPVNLSSPDDSTGEDFVYRPVNVGMLDRAPTALERAGPIYPREWIAAGRKGSVTIEFFIDEKGAVRFPRVVSQADGLLGAAALLAVKGWRFTPPLRKGRPVLTRAQQTFHFEPPAAIKPTPSAAR